MIRASRTEAAIINRGVDAEMIDTARRAILEDISPIDDIRSTFAYRARVSANLVEDFLSQLA